MDIHLQLITFWKQSNSRWPPHMIGLSQHWNGYKSVKLENTELRFGVEVAENHPQHTLWVLINHLTSLFETLCPIHARKRAKCIPSGCTTFLFPFFWFCFLFLVIVLFRHFMMTSKIEKSNLQSITWLSFTMSLSRKPDVDSL